MFCSLVFHICNALSAHLKFYIRVIFIYTFLFCLLLCTVTCIWGIVQLSESASEWRSHVKIHLHDVEIQRAICVWLYFFWPLLRRSFCVCMHVKSEMLECFVALYVYTVHSKTLMDLEILCMLRENVTDLTLHRGIRWRVKSRTRVVHMMALWFFTNSTALLIKW